MNNMNPIHLGEIIKEEYLVPLDMGIGLPSMFSSTVSNHNGYLSIALANN